VEILHLLRRGPAWPRGSGQIIGFWDWPGCALDWFIHEVFPRLTDADVEEGRRALRRQMKSATWTRDSLMWPDPVFHLGSLFGLHDEMLAIVTGGSWPPGHPHYHRPRDIVFGLGSANLVEREMRRLRLRLEKPEHVRAWLAHTELSALDFVRESILAVKNKNEAAALAEALALVRAPEVAPVMLELVRSSKAPQVARRWLDVQVGNAVAGLLTVAVDEGPFAEDALAYLRQVKRQGHAALIENRAEQAGPTVAAQVRRSILDPAEKAHVPFEGSTTPAWLRAALAQVDSRKAGKLPAWIELRNLPPLAVGELRLNDAQTVAVLAVLKSSPLGSSPPLVAVLRQYADMQELEAFAWGLFGAWLSGGAPAAGKWALTALGHLLASDAAVLKLAGLVRAWPSEGQHKRAVHGLECLHAIGSAAARTALSDIAREVKFPTIRNRAGELLERGP
jgi:hypothetical protein